MILATEADKQDILNEVGKCITNNLYLYIDVLMYGIENKFSKIWIKRQSDKITHIILKYHDSFQLYVDEKEEYDVDTISLISEYEPSMISGKSNIIFDLHKDIKELYSVDYGFVLAQDIKSVQFDCSFIQAATLEDMDEIVQLVCSEASIGGHYDHENLKDQYISRLSNNTGRNYIIRDKGKIVGHYATYAEAPGLAVLGGLIVTPEHRGKGYGKLLHCYLSNSLIKENRKVYLYCYDENNLAMYQKLGAIICTEFGKLTVNR